MNSPLLCSLGHVASSSTLRARGVSERQLRAAVAEGRAIRVRRGTYCCPHLDEQVMSAARLGGALTCVSVLRQHGVWAGHSHDLHIQVAPTDSISRQAGIRLHRGRSRFGLQSPWQATRLQSLWSAIHCLDEENALAAIESAIYKGFLTLDQIHRLELHAPRSLQPTLRHRINTSQSGLETIVRLRLELDGHTVESQAFVPGMGHGDLLVDECLGLDVDGREWHGEDRFAIDRDRDVTSEGYGRHVLRLRASHVFETWPNTVASIERALVDARAAFDRRQGRIVVGSHDPL